MEPVANRLAVVCLRGLNDGAAQGRAGGGRRRLLRLVDRLGVDEGAHPPRPLQRGREPGGRDVVIGQLEAQLVVVVEVPGT